MNESARGRHTEPHVLNEEQDFKKNFLLEDTMKGIGREYNEQLPARASVPRETRHKIH